MFEDIFDNKKCLICGNDTDSYFCNYCKSGIAEMNVRQNEIVNSLLNYYEDYGYNEHDTNKIINKISFGIKLRKFIEKVGLQK